MFFFCSTTFLEPEKKSEFAEPLFSNLKKIWVCRTTFLKPFFLEKWLQIKRLMDGTYISLNKISYELLKIEIMGNYICIKSKTFTLLNDFYLRNKKINCGWKCINPHGKDVHVKYHKNLWNQTKIVVKNSRCLKLSIFIKNDKSLIFIPFPK